jgi:hypothetical protein
MQFGIDPARRLKLEAAGAGPVLVEQEIPWRGSRSRVCPALSLSAIDPKAAARPSRREWPFLPHLLPSNSRKLVFRSMPVTQGTETPHHLPATTSLIAAVSWLPA